MEHVVVGGSRSGERGWKRVDSNTPSKIGPEIHTISDNMGGTQQVVGFIATHQKGNGMQPEEGDELEVDYLFQIEKIDANGAWQEYHPINNTSEGYPNYDPSIQN